MSAPSKHLRRIKRKPRGLYHGNASLADIRRACTRRLEAGGLKKTALLQTA